MHHAGAPIGTPVAPNGTPGATDGTSDGNLLSDPAAAAVGAISLMFLLALLAGGLLWYRRRRKRSAEMRASRNSHINSQNRMALTDWARSSSKPVVTISSPDHVRTSRHS